MTSRARALAGIAGVGAFVTSWTVAGALRDGYSPIDDAISRLAELGAPNRWIVTTGMVSFGVGTTLFSRSLKGPAATSLAIAGLASFGVAGFPCTEDCPGTGSVTDVGHNVAAGIHYLAFAASPLLLRRSPMSVALVAFAGTALALHVSGLGPGGLFQRIGLTTLDAWLVATALRQLRASR